jgi:LuxR family maltose regulon positive regulatory protein
MSDHAGVNDGRQAESERSMAIGHEALSRGAWEEARAAFERALAIEEVPEALEGLGMSAWWLDDAATVFGARERAYQLYRKRGDARGAGRVAMTLADDYFHFRGEAVVAKGWHARARRLLETVKEGAEHGWLALMEGNFVLNTGGELPLVRALAVQAAQSARARGEVDLEMTALALEGYALVAEGALAEGMPRLDEATTAAMSGEMTNPVAMGLSCCFLVMACERVGDFERSAEWCARIKELCLRTRFNMLLGLCRAQYATVLVWRGAWEEAEVELEAAVRQLGASRPAMLSEGLLRLADLRRRQGRFEDARTILSKLEDHPEALFSGAAIALDAGDPRTAVHLAERFLRGVPRSKRTERLPALDVLHRAQLALGELDQAVAPKEELCEIADMIATPVVQACALSARGLASMADRDYTNARRAFEDAADLYAKSGAKHEQACVRLELCKALLALGERRLAEAELAEARRAFEELGATWHADQAISVEGTMDSGALGEREQPTTNPAPSGAPGGLTKREIEVLKLLSEGLSNREIAKRLFVSELTVKRHVANLLSKLDLPSRAAAAAYAAKTGLV